MIFNFNRKGQVTIFVIVAVVIVAIVVGFFIFRGSLNLGGISSELQPAYNQFLSCLETHTLSGIDVLGTQGGYIYVEELNFEKGSAHMPFSSQLDFLGNPVPYWYYVSGNGIQEEQVPTVNFMEEQLGVFVEETVRDCDFQEFYDQGFVIELGDVEAQSIVKINDNSVDVNLELPIIISKGDQTASINEHQIQVNSKLGKYYDVAKGIYDLEQETLFLEKYAVDTLFSYAPVTGVEFSCSPQVWNARNISESLREAVEANTLALKVEGGNFQLKNKDNEYFIVPFDADGENVRFLNSPRWPYAVEITPVEGESLIAKPVGNQPGLGILGFCYVAHHFVYDLKYPVMVQIYGENTDDIFQFPVAVIVQGNQPRAPVNATAVNFELPELCVYKNQDVQVNVYDTQLRAIDAEISFECFGTKCDIGNTQGGILESQFPQCTNGNVVARAEGFEEGSAEISTNKDNFIDVILDKTYQKNVELRVDGVLFNGNALVNFVDKEGKKKTKTIYYPNQNFIELSEGNYDIEVSMYADSSLEIAADDYTQCVDIPKFGIGSLVGIESSKTECYTVEIPGQVVTSALSAGGQTSYYVLESELANSNTIEIDAESLPLPRTLDQLQDNYNLLDSRNLEVVFR